MPLLKKGNEATEVPETELKRVFGNKGKDSLSQWLRANLLQQEGIYLRGYFSYSYTIKPTGYEKLLKLLAETE